MSLTNSFMEDRLEPSYKMEMAEKSYIESIKLHAVTEFLAQLIKELEYEVIPNLPDGNKMEYLLQDLRDKQIQYMRNYL